jgi:uncharacterized membrane protein YjgN (DUF898 family)
MSEPPIPLFSDRETKRLSFTGDGAEYFRIWIVNLALTIVATLLWVDLTNLALTVASLGRFRPFAEVGRARTMIETITVEAAGALDEFEAAEATLPGALGDESAGMFDPDIAF